MDGLFLIANPKMSAASACIVMNEDGTIYQGAIANSDKVASIRRILGAYPVLLFGIVELEVVAFAGDQSALPEDTKVNQTQIKVLKELALRGKYILHVLQTIKVSQRQDLVFEERRGSACGGLP